MIVSISPHMLMFSFEFTFEFEGNEITFMALVF